MILKTASYLKNCSEHTASDFAPINQLNHGTPTRSILPQRRSLLGLATKTELKLIFDSEAIFSCAVDLFEAVGMKSDIALNFLSRLATMHELRRAKTHTVRSFFYAHNSRSHRRSKRGFNNIGASLEVTDDPALIEPMVLMTKCMVRPAASIQSNYQRI